MLSKQLPDFFNNYGEYYIVTEEYSYTNAFNLDYLDGNGYLYGTTVEAYTCYSNIDGSQSYYNISNELYDAYGNLRNSLSFNNSRWVNTSRYTYDDMMRVTSSVDAEGNVVTAAYNPWGENHETTDALGNLYVNEYNVKSNKSISYFVAKNNIPGYRANPGANTYKENYSEVSLDQFGRATSRKVYENWPVLSGELSETYTYDIAGNLLGYIDPKRNLNEDGYTKTYQYDALNQLVKVKDALNQITNINYTILGSIASVSLKETESSTSSITLYTKTYDEMGNLTRKADPSGEADVYSYNGLRQNTQSTDRNGSIKFINYDNFNQLSTITQIDSDFYSTWEYQYTYRNPFGYFDELKYENGMPTAQSHYYYDQSGQITQKNVYTGNIQSSLNMQYDDTGNLEQLGAGVFNNNYFYPNYGYTNGRLTKVQTNGLASLNTTDTNNAAYEYYPDGKLKKITYPRLNDNSLLTTEYVYNAIGRLTLMTNKKGNTILSSYAYTYDANGNIATVNDGISTKTYIYDKLNRLTEIRPAVGNKTVYTYDLRGNRLTLSSDRFDLELEDTSYNYDMQNRLKTINKGSTLSIMDYGKDGILPDIETVTGSALQVPAEAIIQDDNNEEVTESELKSESGITREVEESTDTTVDEPDTETRTVSGAAIHVAGGNQTIDMEYYADGLRAGKYTASSSDLYVYDLSGYLVAEAKNSSTITANYVWGPDRVIAKKETGGGEYYYLYNGHGDVVQIVDRNGNIVNNYKYDEWGNILESNETISNPFKYAGEVYDEETGLYYLRARYYDPALGRFINEDSVEGQVNNPLSLNLYTYCYNNPMGYSDPTGNVPFIIIPIVLGALKAIDYGWTTWDIYSSSKILSNSKSSANDKFLAASNIVLAGAFELIEPDDYTPASIPLDDVARKSVMKQLNKAFSSGGIDGGYKFLQGMFGNKADNMIREIGKAMGTKIEIHHIASDKAHGGFTSAYKKIIDKAGISLQDPLNKMALPNHSGGHTIKYKQYVLDYLNDATDGLTGEKAKQALTNALTELRSVLTQQPNMPYKGGL